MRKVLAFGLLAVFLASSATAVQILAFKKESRYGAASMQVAGFGEGRDGSLLIRGIKGEFFYALPADVDWALSKLMTEAFREERSALEKKKTTEEAVRRAVIKLTSGSQQSLTLVEASRRFGVDNPAMVTASGTAARELSPLQSKIPDAASSVASAGSESARTKRIRRKLERAKAEQTQLEVELQKLRADRNPDPISASIRQSRIARLTQERTAAAAQIAKSERDLKAAIASDNAEASEKSSKKP